MELELKKQISEQLVLLSQQQSKLSKEHKGVVVLVEGMGETGKATLINKLITVIDPKYYNVEIMNTEEYTDRVPFTTKYFCRLPEYGAFTFFDSGWYTEVARKALKNKRFDLDKAISDIRYLEESIINNGYILIKLFVCIDKKEQSKRIKHLKNNKNTAWKISDTDIWENKNFDKLYSKYHEIIDGTTTSFLIDSDKKEKTLIQSLKIINDSIDASLEKKEQIEKSPDALYELTDISCKEVMPEISDEEYKQELKKLQKKVAKLQDKMYKKGISTVIAFEGWDAAGKGGAIKRLSKPLDPRNFKIHPISAPTKDEKNKHFLCRFWNKLPKSGHVAIFDRTWYGRVLVERIESFCTYNEYTKAYEEINRFEEYLSNNNILVIKLWMNINKEEQLNRFNSRKANPEKAWKLTSEDWRNRDKWDEYEQATKDMINYTNTEIAPWHIINGNNKRYARLEVLKIVISEMERILNS